MTEFVEVAGRLININYIKSMRWDLQCASVQVSGREPMHGSPGDHKKDGWVHICENDSPSDYKRLSTWMDRKINGKPQPDTRVRFGKEWLVDTKELQSAVLVQSIGGTHCWELHFSKKDRAVSMCQNAYPEEFRQFTEWMGRQPGAG